VETVGSKHAFHLSFQNKSPQQLTPPAKTGQRQIPLHTSSLSRNQLPDIKLGTPSIKTIHTQSRPSQSTHTHNYASFHGNGTPNAEALAVDGAQEAAEQAAEASPGDAAARPVSCQLRELGERAAFSVPDPSLVTAHRFSGSASGRADGCGRGGGGSGGEGEDVVAECGVRGVEAPGVVANGDDGACIPAPSVSGPVWLWSRMCK